LDSGVLRSNILEYNTTDADAFQLSFRPITPRFLHMLASRLSKGDDLLPKIANIVLAGGAFLCIFVVSYVICYYGWSGQRHFSTASGMVLYVVFPTVLASLLFGFLSRSAEFKVNLTIFFLSCVASLYGTEIFLTY
jgi:hypothetical protein